MPKNLRIKTARANLGLTQKELAEVVDVTKQTMNASGDFILKCKQNFFHCVKF